MSQRLFFVANPQPTVTSCVSRNAKPATAVCVIFNFPHKALAWSAPHAEINFLA